MLIIEVRTEIYNGWHLHHKGIETIFFSIVFPLNNTKLLFLFLNFSILTNDCFNITGATCGTGWFVQNDVYLTYTFWWFQFNRITVIFKRKLCFINIVSFPQLSNALVTQGFNAFYICCVFVISYSILMVEN